MSISKSFPQFYTKEVYQYIAALHLYWVVEYEYEIVFSRFTKSKRDTLVPIILDNFIDPDCSAPSAIQLIHEFIGSDVKYLMRNSYSPNGQHLPSDYKQDLLTLLSQIHRINSFISHDGYSVPNAFFEFAVLTPINIEISFLQNLIDPSTIPYFAKTSLPSAPAQKSFTWNAGQIETLELLKSVIESGSLSLNGSQNNVFREFADFLGITLNNPDQTLSNIKKRNNGNETLFLDTLKNSLLSWVSDLNAKKKLKKLT
jgi:hypothetical protein